MKHPTRKTAKHKNPARRGTFRPLDSLRGPQRSANGVPVHHQVRVGRTMKQRPTATITKSHSARPTLEAAFTDATPTNRRGGGLTMQNLIRRGKARVWLPPGRRESFLRCPQLQGNRWKKQTFYVGSPYKMRELQRVSQCGRMETRRTRLKL